MTKTPEEMRLEWADIHVVLCDDEAEYLAQENIEPGCNDFSSRCVLDAYRAGWQARDCAR